MFGIMHRFITWPNDFFISCVLDFIHARSLDGFWLIFYCVTVKAIYSLISIFLLIDFGVDELMEFRDATNCPWLLSNVIDNVTDKQLADGEIKRIIEWEGRKVGWTTSILACSAAIFTEYQRWIFLSLPATAVILGKEACRGLDQVRSDPRERMANWKVKDGASSLVSTLKVCKPKSKYVKKYFYASLSKTPALQGISIYNVRVAL